MRDLAPALDAACLQPCVERRQVGKGRHGLPKLPTRVLDVFLDLAFLPARGRIAERGLEQIVAGHGGKARVDLPHLAGSDVVHGGAHVVEHAAARDAAQHPERLGERVEQHLVGLQPVGPDHERPAVRQLGVRGLQLDPLARDHRPVLAPVELERVAGRKNQWHEHAPPGGALRHRPSRPPMADKGRNPRVGTLVAQGDQVRVQPPRGPARLATLGHLRLQPARQLVGERVQAAGALRHLEPHLHGVRPQILADGVPRQASAAPDLADGQMLPVMPPANDTQQLHVDHSDTPDREAGERGQTRVKSRRKLRPSPGQISTQLNTRVFCRAT